MKKLFGKPDKLSWEYLLNPFLEMVKSSLAHEDLSQMIYGHRYTGEEFRVQLIQNEFSRLDFYFHPSYEIEYRHQKYRLKDSYLFIRAEWVHDYWHTDHPAELDFYENIYPDSSDRFTIWPGKSFTEKDGQEGFDAREIHIPFIWHDLQINNQSLSSEWIDVNECDTSNLNHWSLSNQLIPDAYHTPESIRSITTLPDLPPISWFNKIKISLCGEIHHEDELSGMSDTELFEELMEEYKI